MNAQARTMTATFEIGKTYVMTFIGDSDLKVNYKCIARTSSFATFEDVRTKEQLRRKISAYSDCESVREGNYSMAPSIYADSVIEEKKEPVRKTFKITLGEGSEAVTFIEMNCLTLSEAIIRLEASGVEVENISNVSIAA